MRSICQYFWTRWRHSNTLAFIGLIPQISVLFSDLRTSLLHDYKMFSVYDKECSNLICWVNSICLHRQIVCFFIITFLSHDGFKKPSPPLCHNSVLSLTLHVVWLVDEVMGVLHLDNQQVGQTSWKPCSQQCWDQRFTFDLDKVHMHMLVSTHPTFIDNVVPSSSCLYKFHLWSFYYFLYMDYKFFSLSCILISMFIKTAAWTLIKCGTNVWRNRLLKHN